MNNQARLESIFAIGHYIESKNLKDERYEANVLVYAERKDHGPVTMSGFIAVNIEEEFGQIIIDGLHTVYDRCSNRFTTEDSLFSFVNGTLQIRSKDSFGSEINIYVT